MKDLKKRTSSTEELVKKSMHKFQIMGKQPKNTIFTDSKNSLATLKHFSMRKENDLSELNQVYPRNL